MKLFPVSPVYLTIDQKYSNFFVFIVFYCCCHNGKVIFICRLCISLTSFFLFIDDDSSLWELTVGCYIGDVLHKLCLSVCNAYISLLYLFFHGQEPTWKKTFVHSHTHMHLLPHAQIYRAWSQLRITHSIFCFEFHEPLRMKKIWGLHTCLQLLYIHTDAVICSNLGSGLTRLQRLQGPQSFRTQSSGQGSRLSLAPSGISSGSQR